MIEGLGNKPFYPTASSLTGYPVEFSPINLGRAYQTGGANPRATDSAALSKGEIRQIEKLKQRDREVRAHEQAHVLTGGSLVVAGPFYEFQEGPDGRQYAIGGDVQIDTSKEEDPEATLEKARRIRAAALAPSDPSAQDLKVAAQASQMEIEAQQEINQTEQSDLKGREVSDIRQLSGYLDFGITKDRIYDLGETYTGRYMSEA